MNYKRIIVEVPHRISGFFEIVDNINGVEIKDPERIGSRGAGFNLSAVGRTEIRIKNIKESEDSECKIYINKTQLNEKAETTHFIFQYIKKRISKPLKINISHNFDLPVGCGYGASGAGALGAIFGLDSILNLKLSYREKGKIAHISEVINRTGLGTICGQLCGGLCILKEPGYPCVCEQIEVPRDIRIVCGSFGMIHTKSILTDRILSSKIKEAGKIALKKLISRPNIKIFVKAAIDFVRETNILNILDLKKTKELLNSLNKLKIIGASMNQLERSVFAI
ncbi:MAG: GHMP family kinase ATP-binding protein, partial [Promethearchaeota archaeon]